MKILVVGHSISPKRGSEPGGTWNWTRVYAANHEVWVIAQPEFRNEVDEEFSRVPRPNIHLVWVDVALYLDPWLLSNGRVGMGIHYVLWQELAFRKARELQSQIGFDFVHQVSLGTVSAPPRLWRLGVPFVWGPVGGGQTTPPSFLKYYRRENLMEQVRTIRIHLLWLFPAVRNAAQRSILVLAANHETAALLTRAGSSKVQVSVDGALPAEYVPDTPFSREERTSTTFLWAGSLIPRKGLPLALEALAQTGPEIRLLIAGAGKMRAAWERLAGELGVSSRVEFLGNLSWAQMRECYRTADGFLFTSIRDSFGTVLLEAMAHALPVIALDHQGVAANIPAGAALKIPVTHPDETIAGIAAAMRRLHSSQELRATLGRAAWEFARTQVWELRVAAIEAAMLQLMPGTVE